MSERLSRVCSIFIILLLTVVAVYTDNRYFNIIEAKFFVFFCLSVIIVFCASIVTVYKIIKNSIKFDLNSIEISVVVFTLSCLISSVLSKDTAASFIGYNGWYIGSFTVVMLAVIFFFITRNYLYSQNIWLPIYAVNAVLLLIGIVQFAGLDILGMSNGLMDKQKYQYFSTYGNTNWLSGYISLMLPLVSVFFAESKSRLGYIVNLSFICVLAGSTLVIISDGVYIGLGIALIISLRYLFNEKYRLKRSFLIGIIFSLEALIIELLPCFEPLLERVSGICSVALDIRVSAAALLLFLFLYIKLTLDKRDMPGIREKLFKYVLILSLAALFSVLLYTVFTFNDEFGSHRGLIWRVSLEKYADFDLKGKIFGLGPEMLRGQYTDVERVFEGLSVLSSHSEPVQILMTGGVLGVLSWLSIIFFIIKSRQKAVEKGRASALNTAYFLSLCGYISQSLVNSATTLNLCLLTVVLAFYVISLRLNR